MPVIGSGGVLTSDGAIIVRGAGPGATGADRRAPSRQPLDEFPPHRGEVLRDLGRGVPLLVEAVVSGFDDLGLKATRRLAFALRRGIREDAGHLGRGPPLTLDVVLYRRHQRVSCRPRRIRHARTTLIGRPWLQGDAATVWNRCRFAYLLVGSRRQGRPRWLRRRGIKIKLVREARTRKRLQDRVEDSSAHLEVTHARPLRPAMDRGARPSWGSAELTEGAGNPAG